MVTIRKRLFCFVDFLNNITSHYLERPIYSNLPLQILLVLNIIYSIFYGLVTLLSFWSKAFTYKFALLYYILFHIFFIIWIVQESLRLFCGYSGNLMENVPRIILMQILILVFALPLQIYFTILYPFAYILDRVLGSIMILFLLLEFGFGIYALQKFIALSSLKYLFYYNMDGTRYIPQEHSLPQKNEYKFEEITLQQQNQLETHLEE